MSGTDAQWRFLAERYELLGRLGTGAVGAVWLVRDREGGAEYAIKILKPELTAHADAVAVLRPALEAVRGLGHPNIVAVDDVVAHEGRLALVMRPVPGESLRVLLGRMGRLAPAHAALLIAQLCDALAAAHALGVAHGGVKPANVLLEPLADEAGSLRVGLTDFGLAPMAAAAGVTPLKDEVGLLFYEAMPIEYQAPEIGVGRVAGPAADVYAVGVLLYEAISGRPPFTGSAQKVQQAHAGIVPSRIPGLPEPLWLLIASCLEKNPQHRPAAGELAGMLRGIAPAVESTALVLASQAALPPSTTVVRVVPAPETGDEPGALIGPARVFSAPRRIELAAVVAVVVLAFAATWLFSTIGSGPPSVKGTFAGVPTQQPLSTPAALDGGAFGTGGPSGTASASVTASGSASAGASASASASAAASSPAASASAGAQQSPPPGGGPSPSPSPSQGGPSVNVDWKCATNKVSGSGIVKTSCVGIGTDGSLYIKGVFSAPPGQNISDIKLTLQNVSRWGTWTYTTVGSGCSGDSCQLVAGPYNPPRGQYQTVAGIDQSAHNETSPAIGYWG